MKITYIKLFNGKRKNNVLMKHLREEEPKYQQIINDNRRKSDQQSKNTNIRDNYFLKKIFEVGKQKNIMKKNQVAMFALSLMLITAGYLNYTNKIKVASLGDAKLVASQNMLNEKNDQANIDTTTQNNEISRVSNLNESNNAKDYFTETKIQRDKMYSEMIETYTKILENEQIPDDQKDIASNEIKRINERKKQIATIENLLKTKKINEAIVLINDNSIDVIVNEKEDIETEKIAQIQNIVSRELDADIENIHITTHNSN